MSEPFKTETTEIFDGKFIHVRDEVGETVVLVPRGRSFTPEDLEALSATLRQHCNGNGQRKEKIKEEI